MDLGFPLDFDITSVLYISGTSDRTEKVCVLISVSDWYTLVEKRPFNEAQTTSANLPFRVLFDRIVLVMPFYHLHGLVTYFLSPLSTSSAAVIPDLPLQPSVQIDLARRKAI